MDDTLLIALFLLFLFSRKRKSSAPMHNKETITWIDRKGRKRTIVTEREVHYG